LRQPSIGNEQECLMAKKAKPAETVVAKSVKPAESAAPHSQPTKAPLSLRAEVARLRSEHRTALAEAALHGRVSRAQFVTQVRAEVAQTAAEVAQLRTEFRSEHAAMAAQTRSERASFCANIRAWVG
jgi:hypothetical protein